MARAIAASGDISAEDRKDKVSIAGISLDKARKINGKTIKGAAAVIECTVLETVKTGDHDFFVARCETAYAIDDFEDCWKYENYSPALYVGSPKGKDRRSHRFAKLARKFIHIQYISS